MSNLTQLIQALSTTDDPVEKSIISAEFIIDQLPPPIADLARSCAILRWFDEHIIAALLPLVEEQSDESTWDVETVYTQILGLTFVEHLAWGQVYHSQTAEGLLTKYGTTEPERFRAVAALAAPAYLTHSESNLAQNEALYCYLVADLQEKARELLDELVLAASRREDWHRVLAYYQICDQAAEHPFVTGIIYNAIDYFARGLAAHETNDLKSYNNRGNAYSDRHQYDRAIVDYDRAIQLNPKNADTYNNRGTAYSQCKEYAKAIADYDRTIQLDPKDTTAYNNRGIAYARQGQYSEAIADYSQAIELNSKDRNTYTEQGLFTQAIADYDRAIQLEPDYAMAYNNRGIVYSRQGQYPKAIEDYNRAIRSGYVAADDNKRRCLRSMNRQRS